MKRFLLALVAALILTFTQSPAQASVEGYIQKKCQSDYGKSKAHEKALYYAPLIRHYAAKYHIEPMLLAAIVYHESNFNPRCVSPCGAVGLMQVMPFHFADMGMSARLCFNASTNLDIGCHIFAGYRTRMAFIYRGLPKEAIISRALVAYNMGPAYVSRGISRSRYSRAIMRDARLCSYAESAPHRLKPSESND